jgi:hypothetical protein
LEDTPINLTQLNVSSIEEISVFHTGKFVAGFVPEELPTGS